MRPVTALKLTLVAVQITFFNDWVNEIGLFRRVVQNWTTFHGFHDLHNADTVLLFATHNNGTIIT